MQQRTAAGYWIPALRDPGEGPGRSAGMTPEDIVWPHAITLCWVGRRTALAAPLYAPAAGAPRSLEAAW